MASQALPNQIQMSLRRRDAACRLLLERMQHVQTALKAHRMDGPIGIAVKPIAKLQNPAEALQGFALRGCSPSSASKRACPISLRTTAENPRKSLRLEPTKTAGL